MDLSNLSFSDSPPSPGPPSSRPDSELEVQVGEGNNVLVARRQWAAWSSDELGSNEEDNSSSEGVSQGMPYIRGVTMGPNQQPYAHGLGRVAETDEGDEVQSQSEASGSNDHLGVSHWGSEDRDPYDANDEDEDAFAALLRFGANEGTRCLTTREDFEAIARGCLDNEAAWAIADQFSLSGMGEGEGDIREIRAASWEIFQPRLDPIFSQLSRMPGEIEELNTNSSFSLEDHRGQLVLSFQYAFNSILDLATVPHSVRSGWITLQRSDTEPHWRQYTHPDDGTPCDCHHGRQTSCLAASYRASQEERARAGPLMPEPQRHDLATAADRGFTLYDVEVTVQARSAQPGQTASQSA